MSRKRLPVWRTLLVMVADLAAIGVGLYLAYWLRFYSTLFSLELGFEPREYLKILPWAWGIWFLALRFENLSRRRSPVLDFNVIRKIVTGSYLALLVLIALVFYLRLGQYSRKLSILLPLVVIATLITGRLLLHWVFQWILIHKGIGQSRTAILGAGPLAVRLYHAMNARPEYGMRPIGVIIGRPDAQAPPLPGGLPILGLADEKLEKLLQTHRVDEVILAEPDVDRERLPELLVQCERAMAEFRIVPETAELLLSGMSVETIDGIPLLGIRETPLQGWNAALKRMIDVAAALAGLILFAPILAFFAWRIRRQDGQPAFYRQERMGIDGRRFHIMKLRTMTPDAEQATGPTFAVDEDPRCTPLGAFLRRTHLDEVPQLVNVLRGEMSLVGPRPERPFFVRQFRDHVPRYMARHKVKSGITGWAQVNGLCGPHGTIAERLKYDLYYIENWSLWLDVKILVRTLFGRVRPGPV